MSLLSNKPRGEDFNYKKNNSKDVNNTWTTVTKDDIATLGTHEKGLWTRQYELRGGRFYSMVAEKNTLGW